MIRNMSPAIIALMVGVACANSAGAMQTPTAGTPAGAALPGAPVMSGTSVAGPTPPITTPGAPMSGLTAPAPAVAPVMSIGSSAYRLATGDKIRVTTYGEPALTGEFVVDSSGTVAMPLIGNLPASGSTPQELQSRMEAALRDGYLKEPRVSVEVLTFRPFYILGEVNKPGTYVYSDGLTIMNAVAIGGGFTYRANKGQVYIKRAESAREEAYPLTADVPIAPGDTIRIGERFF